jgi:hypothetical protein
MHTTSFSIIFFVIVQQNLQIIKVFTKAVAGCKAYLGGL